MARKPKAPRAPQSGATKASPQVGRPVPGPPPVPERPAEPEPRAAATDAAAGDKADAGSGGASPEGGAAAIPSPPPAAAGTPAPEETVPEAAEVPEATGTVADGPLEPPVVETGIPLPPSEADAAGDDSPELPHAPEWSPPVAAEMPESRAEVAPEPSPPPHIQHRPALFVVHVTPELAPVAKVGGLADVVFGLGRELEIRGNHVEIILPKYDCMRYDQIWGLQRTFDDLWVPWYGGAIHCSVYFGFVHGRKCFFIEPHSQDNFFNRGAVYGFHDDIFRFAFFSRAAMEFLWKAGKNPDIIHCHDWQTALVPVYLYEIYQPMGMRHPRVCFTIHNFKHQGVTGAQVLHASGLDRPEYYFHYDRLRDNHNPHAINLMKGGIVYANFVTTVSPRYAMEAKDQGQGFGLEPTLHIHHMKYGGVVNGIDYDVWNPEIDPHIPVHFSVDTIEGKYADKKALRDRLLLADNEKPIVSFVGRLDPQKGIELIRHALFYTLGQGGQFVLLGSSPDGAINGYFWSLKRQFNDNPDCHLEIGYNEELAHLVYAGSDVMVVPSRFEPCGLTQLIAMRYGTIPVVREIGGLADTVIDKDFSHRPLHERNGYVFRDYDERGLESALGRAIACYYQYPDHFRELMKNAMRYDYSWNHPGQDYLNIYHYIRDK
ncbi:glycogen synthase [Methylococcus capsulatus]|jgi:starch synthase|uniref:Glycogen synthase n=1 Tax=Methylococcus capsulatus TaxID=414 RepID=A0AA35Y0Y8_METCP|nr:glycogen synthase [Methylococcus capsulatus]CAI8822723.1 starch synthase [Methylococcus capsulatus]